MVKMGGLAKTFCKVWPTFVRESQTSATRTQTHNAYHTHTHFSQQKVPFRLCHPSTILGSHTPTPSPYNHHLEFLPIRHRYLTHSALHSRLPPPLIAFKVAFRQYFEFDARKPPVFVGIRSPYFD